MAANPQRLLHKVRELGIHLRSLLPTSENFILAFIVFNHSVRDAYPCLCTAKSTFYYVINTKKPSKKPCFPQRQSDISIKITPYRKKIKFSRVKSGKKYAFSPNFFLCDPLYSQVMGILQAQRLYLSLIRHLILPRNPGPGANFSSVRQGAVSGVGKPGVPTISMPG